MQLSDTPIKIPEPWAVDAGSSFITYPVPTASQIGIRNGAASFHDGFPPNTTVALDAGGAGPFCSDYNGIFKQITAGLQWLQAGAPVPFDSTFSSEAGGYPQGAVIASASVIGCGWVSLVDNNTADPDTGGANWSPVVFIASSNRTGGGISTVYTYAGNPNGHVAGTAGVAGTSPPDMVWDSQDNVLFSCTTSGSTSTAVWTAVIPSFGSYQDYITATGAGNWTAPFTGIIQVEGWGGGGGTSGSSSGVNAINGGGSGAYFMHHMSVTDGTVYPYAVGAGGTAVAYGGTGNTGGATTWNATATANGGVGSSFASVGSGGTASGGSVLNLQGASGNTFGTTTGQGGVGGSAPRGGGGGSTGSGTGANGSQPGGGGGGPGAGASEPGTNGGAGAILIQRIG